MLKLVEQKLAVMAIYVCENPPAPGNYGMLQVYKDRGRTIARVRNPLTRRRVKSAPEFANTRKYADLLVLASPLASAAHRTLPEGRQRTHYQQLTGKAIQWLKKGKSVADVQLLLEEAVEEIRKQLKQQRIQTLLQLRRAGRKAVFTVPAIAQSQPGGRIYTSIIRKRAQQLAFAVDYSPGAGST